SRASMMPDAYDIFAMGADGSNPVNLTPGDPPTAVNASFSPDAKRILFTGPDGGDFDIFSMNADGSGVTNLTAANTTTDTTPAYSPDGKKIAFDRDVDPGPGFQGDLFLANADGSGAVDLTPD